MENGRADGREKRRHQAEYNIQDRRCDLEKEE